MSAIALNSGNVRFRAMRHALHVTTIGRTAEWLGLDGTGRERKVRYVILSWKMRKLLRGTKTQDAWFVAHLPASFGRL